MSHLDITMIANAIHNPGEPRHFMRLKPVHRWVRVVFEGKLLAESRQAIRLLEVGKDLYDPVLYLPAGDVRCRLARTTRTSHCPLKGDAAYFDALDDDGHSLASEIAWSYLEPFAFAAKLAEHYAFYADRITLEETPL